MPALEQISDSGIELLNRAQIVGRKFGRRKNWQELGIKIQRRIGSQVGGDLLRLVLKNQRACGLERVIVRQRQVDRLVQGDQRLGLCPGHGGEQQHAAQGCQTSASQIAVDA